MRKVNSLMDEERERFTVINEENVRFLRSRYNHVNRWVVADIVRGSANRFPDKPALIYKDITLTYKEYGPHRPKHN